MKRLLAAILIALFLEGSTIAAEKSNATAKYTSATFLLDAGIPVWIDADHAIVHCNKIIIIDRATLITGSFKFTKQAEVKNAENLLILKGDRALVDRYIENFGLQKRHSEAFKD